MASSSNRKWIAVIIAALVLAGIALAVVVCLGAGFFIYNRSVVPGAPPVTVEVTREVILTATSQPAATQPPAPTPPPTQPPAPTAAQPAPAPTPNVVFQNVSLSLDPSVAGGASPAVVPANPPTPDGPGWDIYPQYIEINLDSYLLSDTFHQPRIQVYPVAAFEQMSQAAVDVIASTRQLLKDRPAQVDSIPTLPIWNAGQVFHARLHYLDFKNGSGVVFLSEYAQNFAPINNHDMFYNFQGLTSDGKYYLVATLPASHPKLIPNADISQDQWQKLADDYPAYLNTILPMLESQPANSFTPPLDKLDALIESIEVR